MHSAQSNCCGRFRSRLFLLYDFGLYRRHGIHDVNDRRVR